MAQTLAEEMTVHARGEATEEENPQFLEKVLSIRPHLSWTMEGTSFTFCTPPLLRWGVRSWGVRGDHDRVIRLRKLEREGKLCFPVVAVDNAQMKFFLDSCYGTGKSIGDAIMRIATLLALAQLMGADPEC